MYMYTSLYPNNSPDIGSLVTVIPTGVGHIDVFNSEVGLGVRSHMLHSIHV